MASKTKVYVGNLPEDARREDVEKFFSGLPAPKEISVKNDDRRRTAFAFVDWEEEKDAQEAVDTMNNKELDGKPVSVEFYRGGRGARGYDRAGLGGGNRGSRRPTNTLYVGNINEKATEDDIRDEFGRYGKVSQVRMGAKKATDGRQHAFVQFEELRAAEETMNKNDIEFFGQRVKLDYDTGYVPGGPPHGGGRYGDRDRDRYDRDRYDRDRFGGGGRDRYDSYRGGGDRYGDRDRDSYRDFDWGALARYYGGGSGGGGGGGGGRYRSRSRSGGRRRRSPSYRGRRSRSRS